MKLNPRQRFIAQSAVAAVVLGPPILWLFARAMYEVLVWLGSPEPVAGFMSVFAALGAIALTLAAFVEHLDQMD